MNALRDTPVLTELQEVNRSFDLLLTAIIDLDMGPKRDLPPSRGAQTMAQIAAEYRWDQPTTDAERFGLKLKHDPVREALCHAVRMLGRRLNEIGGTKAMGDACDRQEDYPNGMRRVSIVDKRFDGIGNWIA